MARASESAEPPTLSPCLRQAGFVSTGQPIPVTDRTLPERRITRAQSSRAGHTLRGPTHQYFFHNPTLLSLLEQQPVSLRFHIAL